MLKRALLLFTLALALTLSARAAVLKNTVVPDVCRYLSIGSNWRLIGADFLYEPFSDAWVTYAHLTFATWGGLPHAPYWEVWVAYDDPRNPGGTVERSWIHD